jgi:hypothetical protein
VARVITFYPTSPVAATALFESDWSTATGSGDSALTDGGVWTADPRNTELLEVVSASGLQFPSGMSNVLEVTAAGTNSTDVSLLDDTIAAPESGQDWFYRFYVRFQDGTLRHSGDHSVQLSIGTGALFAFKAALGASDIGLEFNNAVGTSSGAGLDFLGGYSKRIEYDVTYRVEVQIRFGASSVQLREIRIYEVASDGLSEELLWDTDDWDAFEGAGEWQSMATLKPTTTGVDIDMWRRWYMGYNGQTGATGSSLRYYGGVKIQTVDWCGAY